MVKSGNGKCTTKHLCQSPFFNKLAGDACNFIKRDSGTGISCKHCTIFNITCFTEHLRETASIGIIFEFYIFLSLFLSSSE